MRKKAEAIYRLAAVVVLALAVACGSKKGPAEESTEAQQDEPNAVDTSAANTTADTATADTTKGQPDGYELPDNPTWANAIVASSKVADLIRYEQKFKDVLGDTDLEAHAIGCDGCSELSSSTPPTTLEYVFAQEYPGIFSTFVQAYLETTTGPPPADPATYRLTFNVNISPAVCLDPPHTAPCSVWYPCPDDCGRKIGSSYSCSAC